MVEQEPKVWECKNCGAGKRNDVRDPLYCCGKCRKADGAESLPDPTLDDFKSPAEIAKELDIDLTPPEPGTLADYYARPDSYRTRIDPDRLNWDEILTNADLKQCGYRANRKAIKGDWDYEVDK